MTFFMLLDLTGARKLAPAILLLEGGTFLVGFSNGRMARFMFGSASRQMPMGKSHPASSRNTLSKSTVQLEGSCETPPKKFKIILCSIIYLTVWYFQDSGIPVLSSLLIEMTLIALVYVAGGIFLEEHLPAFI